MATRHDLALTWRSGRTERMRASETETILEAAELAGVSLPFGCRTGACASCIGRLVHGLVCYERPPRALKPRDVAAGYVLCCLARPATDCHVAVGAAVQQELVSHPWR